MRTILMTGGTGLVGSHIAELLAEKEYHVHILTRSPEPVNHLFIKQFQWNIKERTIQEECFENVTDVIHLAGATIAQRWTKEAKQKIINSRVESAKFLLEELTKRSISLQNYVGASASGIYQPNTGVLLDEQAPHGSNFLTTVCTAWENSSKEFSKVATNVSINRIGIVLATNGGALEKMLPPFQFGVSPYFGNGKQIYSCIHVKDVARQFIFCLENNLQGTFNCSVDAVTQKQLNQAIAKAKGKHTIDVPTPKFALQLALGKMSILLTDSLELTNEKISNKGFVPEFQNVQEMLNDLLTDS